MSVDTAVHGVVGARLPIHDAAQKVTGRLKYTADMKLPHMLYGKVLFSPVAHANIKRIDTSKAEALPGVRAVACWKNSPDVFFNSCGEEIDGCKNEKIFDSRVRFVGDKVAAVAADTEQIAEKALKLIEVEYEELPFYLDPEEAMGATSTPIHEGGNIAEVVKQSAGDVDAAFQTADRVFEGRYTLPAIHHSAIETHAALADFDSDGKLTVWSPNQDAFAHRVNLSRIFGLPMNKVRVVASAIGGGFGGKIDMVVEPIAALLAIQAGRPVRIVYTRREDIPSSRTRHAMVVNLKTGVKNDGTVVAQDFDIIINAGAHAGGTSTIVWAMCGKLFRINKTPNIRFTGTSVYTNTTSAGAMRGFGSPQEFFAQQRQFYEIAKALNMDLVDFQLKNLMDPDGVDPRFGSGLGNVRVADCVTRGAAFFGWDAALQEQAQSQAEQGRYRVGVGMAVAAHGNGVFGVRPDTTGIMIKLNEDGSGTLYSGCCDMGNGSVTLQRMIAGELLGISPERITCVQADTETTLYDLGNYGSRGTYVGGMAAVKVAKQVRAELEKEAAQLLDEDPARLDFHDDRVWSLDHPEKSATIGELVMHARAVNQRDIVCADTFASDSMAVSYGAHFVKVRVDTETGEVKVLDYAAIHDVGKALNPMNVEGQIEGAVQMGLGYALSEGIEHDDKGKVKNGSFRQYHIFTAPEMPPIRIALVEEIEPGGPYGAKSIGECSVVPAPAAIANAVASAIQRDVRSLPLNKQTVLTLLENKQI